MNLTLSDECKIRDSNIVKPKGILTITDKDGNILVRKENMIVKGGRRYIRDLLMGESTLDFKDSYIQLGNDNAPTAPDDESLKDKSESKIKIRDDIVIDSSADDELSIFITAEGIELDTTSDVAEFGLFLSDNTMFSRVVFHPIYGSKTASINLTYKIYF